MISSKGSEGGTEEESLQTEDKIMFIAVVWCLDFPGQPEARYFNTDRHEGLMRFCRNGFLTTVLKHGPRSQSNMRVCGC